MLENSPTLGVAIWHHDALNTSISLGKTRAEVLQSAWNTLIAAIHSSGKQTVMAVTGGGSLAIGQLLKVPGGSRSLLEALVPYAATALQEFLGGTPDQFCSEPTARAMAMAAWMRARELAPDADPRSLIGIGMTASLASASPKRGEHRLHVGVQTADKTMSLSLILAKGLRQREAEEKIAAKLLLIALGEACEVDVAVVQSTFQEKLSGAEQIVRHSQLADPDWTRLLLGAARCVNCSAQASGAKIIFPGAFHPLHQGHQRMASYAAERLGDEVAYEISITNVDKPSLDFIEINERLMGIKQQDPIRQILLTAAPTFLEKATLLPESTFVMGIDTLVRIADTRYYHDDQRQRDQAIREIAQANCRFLVFGRQLAGKFCCLSDADLPADLRAICDEVPASEFREDVSSTKLRENWH